MTASSTAFSRGPYATQSAVLQPFQLYGRAYSSGELAASHPITLSSLHGREGSSFPDLAPPNDTVNSELVLGMKPSDSVVIIGYQVDEFTHTWSAEAFCCSITYLSWVNR